MQAVTAPASVSFVVNAQPVTQGSKIPAHIWAQDGRCRVWLREQNDATLKEWRAIAATAAKNALRNQLPFDGPVEVTACFYFPRPKSHTRAQREMPFYAPSGRHDIEKLERALYDAITDAAGWADDALVARHSAEKRYTEGRGFARVRIRALVGDETPLFEEAS